MIFFRITDYELQFVSEKANDACIVRKQYIG